MRLHKLVQEIIRNGKQDDAPAYRGSQDPRVALLWSWVFRRPPVQGES